MTMLDPLASYSFFVDLSGVTIAQFKEVSGIGISVAVIENRANKATAQPVIQKMPGSVKYDDIHLSRGKVADPAFWNWIKVVQEGKLSEARKEGSVILYDYAHGEVTRFNFIGWPTRVEIGKLTAGADTVLLESLIIAVEKLEWKAG